MSIPRTPIEDRFDAKVERTDGCWNWKGRPDACGYCWICYRELKRQRSERLLEAVSAHSPRCGAPE